LICSSSVATAAAIIADHNSATAFFSIPTDAIEQAKAALHIAYGHTSHGSQLTTGMTGLVGFMNGLGYPTDLYAWSHGGDPNELDLHDYAMGGDVGYYPDWVDNTVSYLGPPDSNTGRGTTHPETNVIIWSWCGQVSSQTEESMINVYLAPMTQLEQDYPGVMFVYMTGHLDGGGETGNLNVRNNQIRDYCIANDKILYDFADIESYDPNGLVNYMPLLANDNCDYDSDDNGSLDRNWAIDWQNSHTINIDWYDCSPAHTQALNGNLKAYAAWWLWARLAGWGQCINAPSQLTAQADSNLAQIVLNWTDNSSDPNNEDSFIIQRSFNGGIWDNNYASVPIDVNYFTDDFLAPASYSYRVIAHLDDDGSGSPCDSAPSNIASAVIISTDPPAAPSNLLATGNSQNRTVSLTWNDNSTDENGFTVQRQVDGGAWNNSYAGTSADVNTFIDVNITPATYNYRIIACNTYGDSNASNESQVIIIDIPTAPSGLIADSNSGTITLNWYDNSDSETGFTIQRQVDGGAWDNNYALVGANLESYLDDNNGLPPLPNGTYTYRVLAFNENGDSLPSNEAYAVISTDVPAAPSNLNADVNGFDITLTWTDNSDNEENFVIKRAVDSNTWYTLDDSIPPDTQIYYDLALLPDHNYKYRVKARNPLGDSDYSNEASAEVLLQGISSTTLMQDVNGYTGCRDAYLDSANPTYNYGSDQWNEVENSPKCNLVISFDLPAEVIGKHINSAELILYCWSLSGTWQENQYFELYRVTEQWNEGTADGSYQEGSASWNIRTGSTAWTTPGGTYDPNLLDSSPIQETVPFSPQFDITALVQAWADATIPNYGVLMMNNSTSITGTKASEYSEYARPYMVISYTDISPMCPNLDGDGFVDFRDFNILAGQWLSDANNPFPDLDGDNLVDTNDLNVFCDYWLTDCEQ